MIDYIIVIYKNYELLDLQLDNFKRLFPKKDYRLIVVDNTPDSEKQITPACSDPIIDSFVKCNSVPTFDGLSHGNAINIGLGYVTSNIVGIIDSDYFILNENIHEYVYDKFNKGYKAIGTEYNDGKDTKNWVNINPKSFENIPVCFGAYYDTELAKLHSWIITESELAENRSTGYVEVGYRIRKHIFENNLLSENWKTDATSYGNCYFKNSNGDMMGVHYVAGSHRRWNEVSKKEIRDILSLEYSDYKKLSVCLCCGSSNLDLILDLNNQPLANSYLKSPSEQEEEYPLAINYCNTCTHTQLTHSVNPDKLFKNYLYVSGTSKTLRSYFNDFVDITSRYVIGNKILDIACNDGSQLDSYKARGYETYGIDPAENLYPLSSSKGHKVICDYLTDKPLEWGVEFDIITAQNVFAHTSDPKNFLENCKKNISEDGCIFIQTSQADMIRNNEFDTIYHEHISFFSVQSFCSLAKRVGLNVIDVIRTPIHGTSFVFVLSKSRSDRSEQLIAREEPLTYFKMLKYAMFCKQIAIDTKAKIEELVGLGYKVIGYGAAAKGNTFLNFAKFNLDYIVDDNPLKHTLYCPGSKIPILPPEEIIKETGKLCVVPLAWNFFNEIKENVLKIKKDDIIFLRYFPSVNLT